MKLVKRILLLAFLLILISPVLLLAYFGFIPGLSGLFGSDKPRDLGVRYSEKDRISGHAKSKVEYATLPESMSASESIKRFGTREVKMELTSKEASALMNNRPWRYWPYANMQIKFNADGSAQVSGTLIKNKVPGYAGAIGIPEEATAFAMKFLPSNPVFYLKMKASLKDNKVIVFEPQRFEIGRVPLPIPLFLSNLPKIAPNVYALDIKGMAGELSKVRNKKDLIIYYINDRLEGYSSFFYAKDAFISQDKLHFDGRLAEKEATVR